ncbi:MULTISPECIES: hypothetical protein [unclassified Nocardia]|uniref:hypothetical protein n=1 Tax=unclassified Nocardia TaxID=2637762 RepID=UPI001CE4677D|nr:MULTISPECIES: hypothetical protein [unclassified Nocardia]
MLTALAFGLVDAGTGGWLRPGPAVVLLVAVLAGGVLAAVERRALVPVLPPKLLRLSRIRVDLTVAVLAQLIYYGLLFALSQWMVSGHDMTPLQAGMAFLPMTVPIVVVPMLTGRLLPRLGTRPLMGAVAQIDWPTRVLT